MNSDSIQSDTIAIGGAESLAEGQVSHRALEDGSGQDYFVYVPRNREANAPVVVAVHDIVRDAKQQALVLAASAERHGAIVIAPQFAVDRYPNYQRLGRSRLSVDPDESADTALQHIIAEVVALLGVQEPRVYLFGYAAGGRFAMRYAMAHPDQLAGVLLASPGAYTFPDPEKRFPRGLDLSAARPNLHCDPERFLRVPTMLLEAAPGGPAHSRRLRQVGRSARTGAEAKGRSWVAEMNAAATRLQIEPGTSYRRFDGPDHSFNAFIEQSVLPQEIFELLLGPLPGADASNFEMAEQPGAVAEGGGGFRPQRKHALIAVGVIASIALLAPLLLWAQYRSTHIIARHAVVRGHIADVGARLDGVVSTVEVDTGDRVVAGQIVARMQDDHFEAKLRQARSRVGKATRELEVERAAIANEEQRLERRLREVSAVSSAAGADVRVAQSIADEALRRWELQRTLAADGLVAEELVRSAETEYRTAVERVSAAKAQHSAAFAARDVGQTESEGLDVRRQRVAVLEFEIAEFRADESVAEANLDGTLIRAPDDGAVVRRIVEPGSATVVGQPIVSLWVGEDIWVEAWVDESELGNLEVGGHASVTFNSYPDREFAGVVERISASTDFELPDEAVLQPRSDRMRDAPVIAVRIRLEETEETFFPGLSASVGIRKKGS